MCLLEMNMQIITLPSQKKLVQHKNLSASDLYLQLNQLFKINLKFLKILYQFAQMEYTITIRVSKKNNVLELFNIDKDLHIWFGSIPKES